jgi:hypothetical protein
LTIVFFVIDGLKPPTNVASNESRFKDAGFTKHKHKSLGISKYDQLQIDDGIMR